MNRLLIAGAALVGAVALAACGGGTSSSSSSAGAAAAGTTTVAAEQIGNSGAVLVDSSGKALYAADQESSGKVLCTGGCNSFWEPLTVGSGAPTGSSITGKLGVVQRPDGARQVTYNGELLYTFAEDGAGQVTGDGFADAFGGQHFTWHVVHVNSSQNSTGATTSSSRGMYGY